MPSIHVALLRGVNNPGKGARVSMADLRALFERLGFRDARTLLNSGNVVFSAPAGSTPRSLRARIEAGLASELGVAVRVIVLSARDVAAVVREDPFGDVATNPSWQLVVVPAAASDLARVRPLLGERWAPEALGVGSRAAYLWCAKGVAKSPLWAAVERALERTGTARNIATMKRLLAAVRERPSPADLQAGYPAARVLRPTGRAGRGRRS
jgi:uncharacterized protein (DUF1697 family)